MLITWILFIWWLVSSSFASNMTSICSDSKISPLINVHRHQIPQRRTSELTGSVLLSKLTVGELRCWLNPSLSWVEVFAEHSRYEKRKSKGDAWETLLVYLKVKIVLALAIRTTHPPPWPLCMYLWGAHMKERRLIQMILCRLLLSCEHLFFFSFEVF